MSGPTFDRFDILEAYYVFAALNHRAQGSDVYRVFGRLAALGFQVRDSARGPEDLNENAREVYDRCFDYFGVPRPAAHSNVKIVRDLWVCVDCTMYIANGDLPEDPTVAAAIEAGCEREAAEGGSWCLDSADESDPFAAGSATIDFAWGRCDCCGSNLGGSRERAAVVYRNEESEDSE